MREGEGERERERLEFDVGAHIISGKLRKGSGGGEERTTISADVERLVKFIFSKEASAFFIRETMWVGVHVGFGSGPPGPGRHGLASLGGEACTKDLPITSSSSSTSRSGGRRDSGCPANQPQHFFLQVASIFEGTNGSFEP